MSVLDETITPGQLGHIADHMELARRTNRFSGLEVNTIAERDALTDVLAGWLCYVEGVDRVYRYNGTTWSPFGDYARYHAADFGSVDDGATDNASTIQAAVDFAYANGGHVFFQANNTGDYNFNSTINNAGGVRLVGGDGVYVPQHGYNGVVVLAGRGVGSSTPAVVAAANCTVENLLIDAELTALHFEDGAHLRLVNSWLYIQTHANADNAALLAVDAFWIEWLGGGARRSGGTGAEPNIILRGTDNPNVNTINILTLEHLTLMFGAIEYQNLITSATGGRGGRWTLFDIICENLANNTPILKVTGNNFFKELAHVRFIRVERADSGTTGPGMVWNDCAGVVITWLTLDDVDDNAQYAIKNTGGSIGVVSYNGHLDRDHVIDPSSTGTVANVFVAGLAGYEILNGTFISPQIGTTFAVKTNNSSTIDASQGSLVEVDDTSATNVTAINNGIPGQHLVIINGSTHENTTIKHNSAIFLAGGADFVMTFHDTLTLIYNPRTSRWHELSRAANG